MEYTKPGNAQLKVFVDAVLTRLAQYAVTIRRDFVVNWYQLNDTYAFSFEDTPREVRGLPGMEEQCNRVIQVGFDTTNLEKPITLTFMNERGQYTESMPHSLPFARCRTVESTAAAVAIHSYLHEGRFSPMFKYDIVERKGAAPRSVSLSEEQVKVNREMLRRDRAKPAPEKLSMGTRIILAVTKYRLYHIWNPVDRERFPEVDVDGYLETMRVQCVPQYKSELTKHHENVIRNATTVDPAKKMRPEILRPGLRQDFKVMHAQLPNRVKNILLSNDIYVFGQLCFRTKDEMKRLSGMGPVSLKQLGAEMRRLNLYFIGE